LKPNSSTSLVQLARSGQREALDQLFAKSADRVQLYIRSRLGPKLRDEVDSLDVLQETYLKAHKHFARFANGAPNGGG
jgi:RNA polymerase sigma-70 factor (ECF subfamily)